MESYHEVKRLLSLKIVMNTISSILQSEVKLDKLWKMLPNNVTSFIYTCCDNSNAVLLQETFSSNSEANASELLDNFSSVLLTEQSLYHFQI